jgi:hypothetical protein
MTSSSFNTIYTGPGSISQYLNWVRKSLAGGFDSMALWLN